MLNKSIFILAICLISLALSQDVSTTGGEFKTSTSKTLTTTTTTTEEPIESTVTTTSTETTPDSTEFTTSSTTTTLSTTLADNTTSISEIVANKAVLNFTLPQNSSNPCLLLQLAVEMTVRYTAEVEGTLKNASLKVAIPADYNDYTGECNDEFNTLRLHFWNDWFLTMNFTLNNDRYELSSMELKYFINSTWFPNAAKESTGFFTAETNDLHSFSANKGSSFRCNSPTKVDLGQLITFEVTHYQGEPFYKRDQNKDITFHTAVECQADQTGTSKLIPIIVGSALAVLVLLVLIAYLVGRRKHRTGYQSV